MAPGRRQRIAAVYQHRQAVGCSNRYQALRPSALLERHQLERELANVLRAEGWGELGAARILDLGCGSGDLLLRLLALGAHARNLVGVDLLDDRLRAGLDRCAALPLLKADGCELPFGNDTFDITIQCTMLSSVLEADWRHRIAGEMHRVTRAGGLILWYDMRLTRPDNRHVTPIGHREARRYFPGARVTSRIVTLNPILARATAPLSRALAEVLSSIPLLCGHRLTVIRLPATSAPTTGRAA